MEFHENLLPNLKNLLKTAGSKPETAVGKGSEVVLV